MEHGAYLRDVIYLLFAAVLIVATFRKLRISPALGYLFAGALIGPYGLAYITDVEVPTIVAEYGIVFLLFVIGLEMTYDRLFAMRIHVFGFGTLQVVITGLIFAAIADYFLDDIHAAILIGGGLAFSSTALALQLLYESKKQSTQFGRLSIAILLLQDFTVVPLLMLIPLLGSGTTEGIISAISISGLKAIIAMVVIFMVGRILIRPIFKQIVQTKSEELFVAATMLLVLGMAWTTDHFGISLALGAFMAGILVAETEYHHQVEQVVMPFKSLLLGLFFMCVGMSLDFQILLNKLPLIAIISIGLIAIKALIIMILCKMFGFRLGASINTSLLLCQGGEFAFILFNLAHKEGVMSQEVTQILLIVITITMALTPLLCHLGEKLADKFDKNREFDEKQRSKELADLENHVIIVGFGRTGLVIAETLQNEHVNFVGLDIDREKTNQAASRGYPVFCADGSNVETLQSVGIERAKILILCINNHITLVKSLKKISAIYPDLPIVTFAEDNEAANNLEAISNNVVAVSQIQEVGLEIAIATLKLLNIDDFTIERLEHYTHGDPVVGLERL